MVDIIIPAYNAHHTIGKTLFSISKQINKEILKIYLINDGSDKDYSEFINIYKNILDITEIKIKNSGPGIARQVGLDSSKNEYIVFIDADDTFYNEYSIFNLLSIIPEADVAQGKFIEYKENDESDVIEPHHCFLHGKMFRRSIINKYNLKFENFKAPHGDMYEDDAFNQLYLLCCKEIASTNEIIYNYEYNPDSLTKANQNTAQNLKNYVHAMTWLVNELEKRDLQNDYNIAWHICVISYHCYFNYLLTENESQYVFKKMSKIKKMYLDYIDFLDFDERLKLYKLYKDYPVLPLISFYDFLDKIE